MKKTLKFLTLFICTAMFANAQNNRFNFVSVSDSDALTVAKNIYSNEDFDYYIDNTMSYSVWEGEPIIKLKSINSKSIIK